VLRRKGIVGKREAIALVRGKGSQSRIILSDPYSRSRGVRAGMSPAQATSLSSELCLLAWDESIQQIIGKLEPLTPRVSVIEPGVFWLEPWLKAQRRSPKDKAASPRFGTHRVEHRFAQEVIDLLKDLGFPGARVGVADGPVAAMASTRIGGESIACIAPEGDAHFLGSLPLRALPIGNRITRLLFDMGIRKVDALQRLPSRQLEARFGPAGRRVWRLAHGIDPRRPTTPPSRREKRVVLPLLNPCVHLEPLLFILRPGLERLVDEQAQQGQAVSRLRIEMKREWGEGFSIDIVPSGPLTDHQTLFHLARIRLEQSFHHLADQQWAQSQQHAHSVGAVIEVSVEVLNSAPISPSQPDLFMSCHHDPLVIEAVLTRLCGRLGEEAVSVAEIHDEYRPEEHGRWVSLLKATAMAEPLRTRGKRRPKALEKPSPPPLRRLNMPFVRLRLLEPSKKIERIDEQRFLLNGMGEGRLMVRKWHGPERLSGHWWKDGYDRDYYWALASDKRLFWIYQERNRGHWFLHGWLD
jgi:nucleotidyltransferase/DNA polymerase involved in DNA repair